MLENLLRQELTHACRVSRCGRRVKAPFLVAADHALAVVVATVVWQGTDIPPACIELRPAHVAELLDAVDI